MRNLKLFSGSILKLFALGEEFLQTARYGNIIKSILRCNLRASSGSIASCNSAGVLNSASAVSPFPAETFHHFADSAGTGLAFSISAASCFESIPSVGLSGLTSPPLPGLLNGRTPICAHHWSKRENKLVNGVEHHDKIETHFLCLDNKTVTVTGGGAQ